MEQKPEGKDDSGGFAKSKMKRTVKAGGEERLKQWFGCSTDWDANCVDSQQACSINWTLQNTQK